MTADPEQVRRDAEREARIEAITAVFAAVPLARYDDLTKLGEAALAALLAELDAVPALVEALRKINENAEAWHGPPADRGQDRALAVIAEWCRETLTVYEQSQGKP